MDYERKEGDRLDEVLPGLEVVDLAGHSPGQCGFWHAKRGILFGGDVMIRSPLGRLLPMVAAAPDIAEAKRSIHKVAELNVATICLGHGQLLIGNAVSIIKAFASKFS